ncbi:hypothetical protein MIMGU_mgv1a017458mg [Erythranthe guttata]|uniref:Uncharacterized protein n=1 Tax=Erythranthe guttata TaxID=4155 RepID=A0A022RMQ6_ERYGU|nr:hypothetical protein MIMGU_mgv1a017458mg [Erythranthe guttata]
MPEFSHPATMNENVDSTTKISANICTTTANSTESTPSLQHRHLPSHTAAPVANLHLRRLLQPPYHRTTAKHSI